GLPGGTLAEGKPADIILVDPEREWTVDPSRFLSRGKNTPFAGLKVHGEVVATFVGGRMVYHRDEGIVRQEGRRVEG
ncbi:MAG: amidohydrolase family protein, partial [Proteobacteria bacterium]|nr:amidohydrolase family protein [Pseudomonadota bacterium]